MKLQSLTIIFIIIILPVILILSAYIGYEIKTIEKQNMYNTGVISATHDAVFSFEINSKNDSYSNNAETKREILKSAVKTFENSLSVNCNLGIYGNDLIEQYIPAIVFGMYDGFYIYTPTNEKKGEMKNYIYYSENIKQGNIDVVINYSLDNYITVIGKIDDEYVNKAGYLVILEDIIVDEQKQKAKYKDIDITDGKASFYYRKAKRFTSWFNRKIGNKVKDNDNQYYLKIDNTNDPEKDDSKFVQHKRSVMKEKIESILNSSIAVYSRKTNNNYKMPKLNENEWEKIYNNISIISFVQGMNLGFKKYNNYCVLNSTNNQEFVNKNLLYFIDSEGKEYHDIRCHKIANKNTVGYKIGDFEKNTKEEVINQETGETKKSYIYKHDETACYECINGFLSDNTDNMKQSVYEYVENSTSKNLKKSYYEALAREREDTTKLSDRLNNVV